MEQRDADRRHEAEAANLQEKNASAVREWENHTRDLEARLSQAEERIKYEIERGEAQSDHWMNQLANERESSQRALELARESRGRVESELTITRKPEEHAIGRAERLEPDKEALQTKLEGQATEADSPLDHIRSRHEVQMRAAAEELEQVRSQQSELRTQLQETQADLAAKSELIAALRDLKGSGGAEEVGGR